jgi:hypothetical protein
MDHLKVSKIWTFFFSKNSKSKIGRLWRLWRPIIDQKFYILKCSPCNTESYKRVSKNWTFFTFFFFENFSKYKIDRLRRQIFDQKFYILKYSPCNKESYKVWKKLIFFFRSSKQHWLWLIPGWVTIRFLPNCYSRVLGPYRYPCSHFQLIQHWIHVEILIC